MDWSGVFPGPVVMFALGLYDVAMQGAEALLMMVPGDVLVLCLGAETTLLGLGLAVVAL